MENEYILTAIRAALEAGKAILSIYNDPTSDFEIEQKADHSPLTIADRKAHQVIVSYLNQTPYPILSEEGKHLEYAQRQSWETLWIVDPLDGTKEFIKRNGEFTVNIALVHQSIPVSGVIYVPVKDELYFSTEATGAYKCEGATAKWGMCESVEQWMACSQSLPVAQSREAWVVVASRSHMNAETEAYIRQIQEEKECVELISSGSSLKICLVAEGKADVYPRFAPTMEWDTAAGHAIARAAGMEMYQAGQAIPLLYNKEILLNPWFIVEPKRSSK